MTKHAIFDFLKHKRIERSYQQEQMEESLFKDLSPSDGTLDAIYYKEVQLALQMAIEQFPERRRLIFEMSRIQGMSNLEIAEKLDISVRTVERQIYLSLLELKKIVYILFFLHFI
jgi:RNA polymerase sigma factor, sigma-70 family